MPDINTEMVAMELVGGGQVEINVKRSRGCPGSRPLPQEMQTGDLKPFPRFEEGLSCLYLL